MQYEPSPALLNSMRFIGLFRTNSFIWIGGPLLLYLGNGRLMNKVTNQTVTLKATNDREFMGELIAHGWRPVD